MVKLHKQVKHQAGNLKQLGTLQATVTEFNKLQSSNMSIGRLYVGLGKVFFSLCLQKISLLHPPDYSPNCGLSNSLLLAKSPLSSNQQACYLQDCQLHLFSKSSPFCSNSKRRVRMPVYSRSILQSVYVWKEVCISFHYIF